MRGLKTSTLMVTIGTGTLEKEKEKHLGLVSNHNYAVLDLKIEDDVAFALIKNPWREPTIWQADQDSKADRKPSDDASKKDDYISPGTFWIPYNDFRRFRWAYLNWSPSLFNYRQDTHVTWDIPRSSVILDPLKTPQFTITSSKKESSLVWLLLCRHLQDAPPEPVPAKDAPAETLPAEAKHAPKPDKRHALGYISLWLYEENGNRVYLTDRGTIAKEGRYVDAIHTLVRMVLPADTTYTILPRQKEPSLGQHNFTLSAFSDSGISLNPANDIYTHSVTLEDEWAFWKGNCKGKINEPDFGMNPQYSFKLAQPGHVAISLECWNTKFSVNLMLYRKQGERVFTVKDGGIALGDNKYRPGYSLIQTQSHEPLQADTYTLLASTYEPEQLSKFTIRIDSTAEVAIKEIDQEGSEPDTYTVTLPRAVFPSRITAIAIPFNTNAGVDLILRVVVKFESSFYPTLDEPLGNSSSARRSPLRIIIQSGTGPNAQVIAQSNYKGRFEDAGPQGQRLLGVRVTLQMVASGNLFLVLERLVGFPIPGSEERFNVQVFHQGGNLTEDRLWVGEQWLVLKEYDG
jgi:calpain-7